MVGTITEPLYLVIGMLTFLSGFESALRQPEFSRVLEAFFTAINLLLALVGSFFIAATSKAGQDEPDEHSHDLDFPADRGQYPVDGGTPTSQALGLIAALSSLLLLQQHSFFRRISTFPCLVVISILTARS